MFCEREREGDLKVKGLLAWAQGLHIIAADNLPPACPEKVGDGLHPHGALLRCCAEQMPRLEPAHQLQSVIVWFGWNHE